MPSPPRQLADYPWLLNSFRISLGFSLSTAPTIHCDPATSSPTDRDLRHYLLSRSQTSPLPKHASSLLALDLCKCRVYLGVPFSADKLPLLHQDPAYQAPSNSNQARIRVSQCGRGWGAAGNRGLSSPDLLLPLPATSMPRTCNRLGNWSFQRG